MDLTPITSQDTSALEQSLSSAQEEQDSMRRSLETASINFHTLEADNTTLGQSLERAEADMMDPPALLSTAQTAGVLIRAKLWIEELPESSLEQIPVFRIPELEHTYIVARSTRTDASNFVRRLVEVFPPTALNTIPRHRWIATIDARGQQYEIYMVRPPR